MNSQLTVFAGQCRGQQLGLALRQRHIWPRCGYFQAGEMARIKQRAVDCHGAELHAIRRGFQDLYREEHLSVGNGQVDAHSGERFRLRIEPED